MYEVLSYIKKLDKLANKYARVLSYAILENPENLKDGQPAREAYNEAITKVRDKFNSYFLPVLEMLSKSPDELRKKRKFLFYLNTLLVAITGYLGFKYTIPFNLAFFSIALGGAGVNLFLNYKLSELIYSKEEVLESYKLIMVTMNKSDEIIDEFIKEYEKSVDINDKENSISNESNYEYNPNEKIEYTEYAINVSDKSKVKKRIKRDGDK